MTGALTILIVGGYGTFGGRTVELLEGDPRLHLIVAGRDEAKARSFCAARTAAKARLTPARFDRSGDLAVQLASLAPALVVDASGPFQAYGARPFRLVEACIAARIAYLDLADGSDFVAGIAAFDAAARDAGVFVLSGVSSFPVLTAAVMRALGEGLATIQTVHGGIAPSPYAGVGLNVIRAIASYAGRPVAIRRDGEDATGYPFTSHMRATIAPPGRLPLHSALFSLVDVPDLRALPALRPELKTVWMGAGPTPLVLHRLLIAAAWLVRLRLLPSLSFLAPVMSAVINTVRWGEHRGGMFIAITGADAGGARHARSWHLLAEGNDGPLIPSMAVDGIIRRLLDGRLPAPGARAATDDLDLADYEALFAERTIYTGRRDDSAPPQGLYPDLFGTAWASLPPAIRAMHEGPGGRGTARVRRGRNPLGRLAAWLFGFPPAAESVPVEVRFERAPDGTETWRRRFGPHAMTSTQSAGVGRAAYLVTERFGPTAFDMALVADNGRLDLVLRRWRIFGIPLPLWAGPHSTAWEADIDGRFHFHVEIRHPLTGLIVAYDGHLTPGA